MKIKTKGIDAFVTQEMQVTIEVGGVLRRWNLPTVLSFEGRHYHFYEVLGYRSPKKGEWFISGATPDAYFASNDLTQEYLIAIPADRAKQKFVWTKAEAQERD